MKQLALLILPLAMAAPAVAQNFPPAAGADSNPGEPAHDRPNLTSLVWSHDYPASALRNGEQGTTAFLLSVGADGRVSGCTITASSGSAALDNATCRIMRERARFMPARNAASHPTTDIYASHITWRIAGRPAPTTLPTDPDGLRLPQPVEPPE